MRVELYKYEKPVYYVKHRRSKICSRVYHLSWSLVTQHLGMDRNKWISPPIAGNGLLHWYIFSYMKPKDVC